MAKADKTSIHDMRFPNESTVYRRSRDALLKAEMELRRQVEAVAAQRRALAPGGQVREDYVFEEGEDARSVRFSSLFGDKSALIVYSFMYGPKMREPCPSCTSIIDCMDGAHRHVSQQASLVVVAKSPIARIRAFAGERGWTEVRLLSSAGNGYNSDYHGEDAKGAQWPMLNVFAREDGVIRHTYGTELLFARNELGQDGRHVDSIWPIWGLLDFTPQGRGKDFRPRLNYG
jgi:predicted dithiol-disulfide oxidoreductase (DUF899 family)